MTEQPELPYAGSSGYAAGVATSEERARRNDTNGTTSRRQMQVLALLSRAGSNGLTWRELSMTTGLHHGAVSGALSNLHKVGRVARLTERRGRCFVYVTLDNVNGRDTGTQGRRPVLDALSQAMLAQAWDSGHAAGVAGEDPEVNPYE